jgi:hypothetical protein
MAPPKKFKETPNLFSFRCEKSRWANFLLATTVRGTTPTEVFDGLVDRYIEDNKEVLAAVSQAKGTPEQKQPTPEDDEHDASISDAESADPWGLNQMSAAERTAILEQAKKPKKRGQR